MLIWKLLRRHVSAVQLAGFFAANLVGVTIILAAVQLWRDVRPAVEAPDSFMSKGFVVLSKKSAAGFSADELQDIGNQPFVTSVGEFTPARYSITGGINVMGMGFETYLFFESVPDHFLDTASDQWGYSEGARTVPIILPRNYLNLYNFGFASTQGLPQITESVVSSVPMRLLIGGREEFEGRVVAFSNRLNTILVPENFIDLSNEHYADRPEESAKRIILEVPNAADSALASYLNKHEYVAEGDNPRAGQMSHLLRVAVSVVGGVGVAIALLSVFVLMLSIFLLLQKNSRKLADLLLLGYTPAQVARPYIVLTCVLNGLVLLCAVPAIVWARRLYMPMISMLADNVEPVSLWPTMVWGMSVAVLVSLVNIFAIRRKVTSLWWG